MAEIAAAASYIEDAASGIGPSSTRRRYVSLTTLEQMAQDLRNYRNIRKTQICTYFFLSLLGFSLVDLD